MRDSVSKFAVETLIVPGLGGSGPEHWQTLWESRYGYERVEQAEWDQPELGPWLGALDARVARARAPIVLVAHSLGCALVARWAAEREPRRVIAALLVAPADVDALVDAMPTLRSFAPVSTARLPFASTVIASSNDPYVSSVRARAFASAWQSRFEDFGALGHINAQSNLGDWDLGHAQLEALIERALAG